MKTIDMTIPHWGSKIYVLMAALAVTVFGSSCSDEDFSETSRTPLQLSVTTDTPVLSRAIVNDKYLPDGSQIGVTLTAENGGDYDGISYFNLPYTASGTGDAQTWASVTPASLSTTAGKVTAYYPYNPDVTDLTAIPVETASQTDYMYAKPITGINFTSAQTKLTMQHALTDIRISFKKGTYTGTGKVTKVTAKAPGFATGATMHVETGALDGVTGNGAEYIQEFDDLTLTGTAYNQDFLTVPYTKSTSGEVTVFVIVDDKKFNAVIPYTEAFQQGYSYVYNLTLDNSELTLEGVDITKWNVMAKEEQELEFYDNQYIVEIQVPSDGYEFIHNIASFTGTVDWGDGTTSTYDAVYSTTHIYEKAGTYTVVAQGNMKSLGNSVSINNVSTASSKIITKLINIGKEMGLVSHYSSFRGQTNLNEIKAGALDGMANIQLFGGLFQECTSLTSIPEGLFDKCTTATDFGSIFQGCTALTEIPKGLFAYKKNATTFESAFQGCTSLKNIPNNLFENCSNVTDFDYVFGYCSNLETIASNIFTGCTKVETFRNSFYFCSSLKEIPKDLFNACTEVTDFYSAFFSCNGLTEIPSGLFDYNTKVTSFEGAFNQCNNLTGESPYTVINVDGVETKVHLYERSQYPEHFTAPTSYSSCFYNCTGLTDYDSILTTWK